MLGKYFTKTKSKFQQRSKKIYFITKLYILNSFIKISGQERSEVLQQLSEGPKEASASRESSEQGSRSRGQHGPARVAERFGRRCRTSRRVRRRVSYPTLDKNARERRQLDVFIFIFFNFTFFHFTVFVFTFFIYIF